MPDIPLPDYNDEIDDESNEENDTMEDKIQENYSEKEEFDYDDSLKQFDLATDHDMYPYYPKKKKNSSLTVILAFLFVTSYFYDKMKYHLY